MTAKPSLNRCNRHGLIPIYCLLLLLLVVWAWQTWVNAHLLFAIWWLQICCCGSMSLVKIGWLPTNCLLFSHIFWSSEPGRCGLMPTCYLPYCGYTLLWSCEPSTNEFCKPCPILCLLYLWLHTPNRWVWWTWVDSHLSSPIVYGHGLIPICYPPSGEPRLMPSCRSPFGEVGELSGHGLIPICCPPSGEPWLMPSCCSPSGPNWLSSVDMAWCPFVVLHLVNLGWCTVVVRHLVHQVNWWTWVNAHLSSSVGWTWVDAQLLFPVWFVRWTWWTWVDAHLSSPIWWTWVDTHLLFPKWPNLTNLRMNCN